MILSNMDTNKNERFSEFIDFISPLIDNETKMTWLNKLQKKQKTSETDAAGYELFNDFGEDQFQNVVTQWFMKK